MDEFVLPDTPRYSQILPDIQPDTPRYPARYRGWGDARLVSAVFYTSLIAYRKIGSRSGKANRP